MLLKDIKIKIKLLLVLVFGLQAVSASTTKEVFAKYSNKYFIETGSCIGDGIQMALEGPFEQIYSIELSDHFYRHCCQRFAAHSNVGLFLGNSVNVLPEILDLLDAPATFWLDGHYSWNGTARGDTNSPILEELDIIGKHHIKNHTILIDDVRQFGTIEFDFIELEDVIKKILSINENYQISFEDGYIPNDVLVAKIIN